MKGLLVPKFLLARLHVRHMAGQPVMELYFQFCFERRRLNSRTYSSDQVQEVAVGPFNLAVAPSIDGSVVNGSQKSGMPQPASFAP